MPNKFSLHFFQLKIFGYLVLPFLLLIIAVVGPDTAGAQTLGDSAIVDTRSSDSLLSDSVVKKMTRSPFNSEVKYNAKDSIIVNLRKKMVYLYGESHMVYESMNIEGDFIQINFQTNEVMATFRSDSAGVPIGRPVFKDKEDTYNADTIRYNMRTRKGLITRVRTEEGEGFLFGEKVKKDSSNNLFIKEARYTTCNNPEHPHFYIKANRMKMIPGKRIVSGPAFIYIEDVPAPAFLPFGFFPITKGQSSGIILPTYGFSPGRGYFLRNGGYYLGISDRFDLALTGDIYGNFSWRTSATSFYAKRYRYGGDIGFDYARLKNGEREDLDYSQENSYRLTWRHSMDRNARPGTLFSASVNFGSSNYQKLNSYNPSDILANTMQSSITYSKTMSGGKYNLRGGINHSQNTSTRQVNLTLPDLTFDVARFFPFRSSSYNGTGKWYEEIGASYTTSFKNQLNTVDSMVFTPQSLKSMQYGILHSLPISANFKMLKYIAVSPGMNVNGYWYMQTVNKSFNRDSNRVEIDTVAGFRQAYNYSFNTSFTTRLFGMYKFRSGKVEAIRHVMVPTINLTYQPDFGKDKYDYYRNVQSDSSTGLVQQYSVFERGIFGGPSRGQVGAMTFRLNNNLEMKVRKKTDTAVTTEKVKIFENFDLSTGYNFLAKEFKVGNIQLDMRTILFKTLNIQLFMQADPYALDSAGLRINTLEWTKTKAIGRLTNTRIMFSTSLNSDILAGKSSAAQPAAPPASMLSPQEMALLNMPGGYVDFNVPWNLTLNYVFDLNKPAYVATKVQTINFNGDLKLTEKWKIGFSSGYDITNKDISFTSLDFYRDLHCWEFRFNWVPFGARQFFNFGINAKASMLQDLKLNRRRDWYDR